MASISDCRSCGESDHLRGRPLGDDIEITCERCGARWLRGAPRCNACGGEDVVFRPQLMTRQPRGNQVAVVGRRQLPLCASCDADAIARSEASNRPVPESYVSTFLFGPDPAPRRTGSAGMPPQHSGRASASTAETTRNPRNAQSPPRARPKSPVTTNAAHSSSRKPAQPTVRQAIEAYLAATADPDSLAMLLLGKQLGPASRLEVLEHPGAGAALAAWIDATWGDQGGDRRQRARAAIVGALDHWHHEGWITAAALEELR